MYKYEYMNKIKALYFCVKITIFNTALKKIKK